MTEYRFDHCCWWYILLLVACVLAVVAVMLVVSLLEADHKEPEPAPVETVETETQAESAPPVAYVEPVVQEDNAQEATVEEPAYQAADRGRDEWQIAFHFIDNVDTYLSWTGASYDHLVDSGRRLDRIDRGVPAIVYPCTEAYRQAAYIAYYALCWDTFIAYYAPSSLWVGRGLEVARKCEEAGIRWEMAAATLYAESDWGRQRSGLIWGNASTLDGWISWCLREMANPNDVDCFVNEFHMPANIETYHFNFGNVVERARAWRP